MSLHRDRLELSDGERIRRYAVPGWMIAECTAARERGDWRAACEAALIDVAFDDAGPVAELLAGFAPDLLRWHLPRAMGGTVHLAGWRTYLLAGDGPVEPDTMVLVVRTPDIENGANRLTLDAVRAGDVEGRLICPLPPYLWDVRRAAELPLTGVAGLADSDVVAAWTAAGWELDDGRRRWHLSLLGSMDPVLAARELRRVSAQFGRASWGLLGRWNSSELHLLASGDRIRVIVPASRPEETGRAELRLLADVLRPPIDRALIETGRLDPADLHPLVRDVLAPGVTGDPDPSLVPAGLLDERVFRVRCRGVWHWVSVRGGRLALPEHSDDEWQRELSLRAFGGEIGGCFKADLGWRGLARWLPKALREHRRDLWLRLESGGSRVVTALLDAGLEPRLCDGGGRTLVHLLGAFGDPAVLPRLLAAGLDVDARDREGITPLFEALTRRWPIELIIALVDAGADPRLPVQGVSPLRYLKTIRARDMTPDLTAALGYLKEKKA
ncbi:hypothetical protein GCM10010112_49690 [Actinoplanes lobatus]|uniref:Ankyrin repeat protein n=1 Tax=Actinoplanes lobatus TaxID=113568 RepID=A0A7W7MKX6_9ACTN|nr:hypothetical protein [Actinoplanes lobatus]MBB4754129.1 hypothetical protein [Actinoplanes lobatus]GGN77022.1 hypothetical protein GCM10010112_49690 [Actinoplanes lobatus]GIE40816.1 hypothetical protein Alo02nite_37140 [Actinoplanes lobatus]